MSYDIKECDNVEMYVLGGLEPSDIAIFEEHLLTCSECAQQVMELREIVDMLPVSSDPVAIPSGMKERVLGNILQKQPLPFFEANIKKRTFSRWINIGLVAAVIGLCMYTFTLRGQVNTLHDELADINKNEPAQGLRMDKAVTLSSAAQDIVAQGLATIVIDTQGTHLLVQAEKLPKIKDNEAFQVWLIKGENVVNAGTFFPHDGKGGLYFTLDQGMTNYDQIAITQEPDAFGTAPRGTPVLTASLQL